MALNTEAETAKIRRVSDRSLQRWRDGGAATAFLGVRSRRTADYDEAVREFIVKRTFASSAAAPTAADRTGTPYRDLLYACRIDSGPGYRRLLHLVVRTADCHRTTSACPFLRLEAE